MKMPQAVATLAYTLSKLFFNVDPADAQELPRHTKPELDEHLAHLDVYTAARLLVGNRELPGFTFVTNPSAPVAGEATAIRQECAAAPPAVGEPPMQQLAGTAMKRRMAERER